MKKKKCIIIIVLVITIIILSILVGVALNLTRGEQGIKVDREAEQYEISEIQEKLEQEKEELYTIKNGEALSLQEYIDHLVNKGIIKSTDVENIDDNSKNIVVEEYVFLIKKEENGDIKIEYEGIQDLKLETKNVEGNVGEVLLIFRNEKGIKEIHYPKDNENEEETIIYVHGKTKVAIDYNMEDLKTYEFNVIYEDETNKTHEIAYKIPPPPPPSAGAGGTTHTAKQIQYTWEELSKIAKVISDNYGTGEGKVNNNTAEVNVSINGKADTLGIGDWTTVNGVQVRILGFNHDALTNEDAYGEGETNTYAGISFEYAISTTEGRMDPKNTSEGGWGACELRGILNNTTINSLENKQYIKEVSKQYIKTYNQEGSVTTSQDRLWLLSCSEIWNNGREGQPYGYAIAKEGEQYKYYANLNASSSTSSGIGKKLLGDGRFIEDWWLRSPCYRSYEGITYFCRVDRQWLLQ